MCVSSPTLHPVQCDKLAYNNPVAKLRIFIYDDPVCAQPFPELIIVPVLNYTPMFLLNKAYRPDVSYSFHVVSFLTLVNLCFAFLTESSLSMR